MIDDGIVTAVHASAAPTWPDPPPRFTVREYDRHGLDEFPRTGTDEAGREYYEYPVLQIEADRPEIVSLLVASTTHVTAEEAEGLTKFGYARGDHGWFFYVGDAEYEALPELAPISQGLEQVIQMARRHGCAYVLLDADASALEGVATYGW